MKPNRETCVLFGKPTVATNDFRCNECVDIIKCAEKSGIVRSYNKEYDMRPSVYKYWDTHDWNRWDVPVCRKCGGGAIGLGFMGDQHWRNSHRGWKHPCKGEE